MVLLVIRSSASETDLQNLCINCSRTTYAEKKYEVGQARLSLYKFKRRFTTTAVYFSFAIKSKRKVSYAKLRKFMRRFVKLRIFFELCCVKYRTLFFVVKIYRVSEIIYIQYKSNLLLPSILSFHPLCIKRASSLFHSFLNKLVADVTHTIKTDYFSQSKLFSP